jgi:hypothetical protein
MDGPQNRLIPRTVGQNLGIIIIPKWQYMAVYTKKERIPQALLSRQPNRACFVMVRWCRLGLAHQLCPGVSPSTSSPTRGNGCQK